MHDARMGGGPPAEVIGAAEAGNVTVHLVTTAVSLIALLALSSDEVRDWVRHRGRENRRPRRDGGRRKAIAKG